MKISTEDCRAFLVDVFRNHISLVAKMKYDIVKKEQYESALNPKLWKRYTKCKPSMSNNIDHEGFYCGVIDVETHKASDPHHTEFVCEREFFLMNDVEGDKLAFVVLENKEGKLFLGPDIGD